ncbi:chromate transporter [Butyrivibrio sp. MC2013]|uniref:chromate transporter n=1 Tax=Butyrivibrio sp. MC2013 TaxID=1280686 RepID=UPI00041CE707|nr:chromate transporter [Butyrivibrio sp. MC2013]
MNELISLFLSFLKVGLFSVGGGYAAIPLISDQVVDTYQLMSASEFADLVTIAEMTPGPIIINAATFVGMRVGGIAGALICTLASISLPVIITMTLGIIYYRYRQLDAVRNVMSCMRPGVVALIIAAGISIASSAFMPQETVSLSTMSITIIEMILFAISLIILRKYKINPIAIIWGNGILGIAIYLFTLV